MNLELKFESNEGKARFLDVPWYSFFSTDGNDLWFKTSEIDPSSAFAQTNAHCVIPEPCNRLFGWEEKVIDVTIMEAIKC